MKMKPFVLPSIGLFLFASATNVGASVVVNASTVIASSTFSGKDAVHLTDSSGMSASPADILLKTHDNNGNADTMWHAAAGTQAQNQWLEFTLPTLNLGESYTLENLYIWQFNQNTRNTRGVKSFDLWVSPSLIDPFINVANDIGLNLALGTGQIGAQTVTLASALTNVRRIKFDIDSSWDATNGATAQYVGLSEVRFGVTVVPEPSAFGLFGFGAFALLRRRRG